ncbi:MAG: methylmalonyl-CoA mutase family protein [Deltaproteobacteria bacterium]|nr:methylmalonyl-CoA mutase family protein [Deltaproteobacteria bacterium]MBW2120478.1 methylmalonyl-CoA mutase family protein [Deltaproteobacteria bacterium]
MRDEGELEDKLRKWEGTTVAEAIKRVAERREEFETTSGIELKRLYTPLDISEEAYVERLGFPGEYPFTRGVRPTMYRGRLWTMRMYSGFATAEETNMRYKYLIGQGQTGLSVAFDLPTQMGYDSDHPLAAGEVGRVGVAIDSLADMETLFDGIPLGRVSTNMTINSTAVILLAMYLAVAEKQGVRFEEVRGTIQNDILKEYIARGTYIFPPRPSMRIIADIFAFCRDDVPRWNTISISGYHIREAGSNAVQELAFTLANGIAYVKTGIDAGLDVDDFAPRLSFHLDTHNNFLEEIAKFRAGRRLWARIMKERFGAKNPASWMFRLHAQGAGCSLTRQQPDNNVVRVAIQALAAVLGGTQSLQTNSKDEAYAIPTEETVRTALRTQQIIAHESGVADFIDPLGGSYAVEALTDEIEGRASEYIERIEAMGGAVQAIESGYIQGEIAESAYRYQRSIETKDRIIVGLNEFTVKEAPLKEITRIRPEVERAQREKLEKVKKERDPGRLQEVLLAVKEAAEGRDNLVFPTLDAVRAYATVGEITDALRAVFGEYEEKG